MIFASSKNGLTGAELHTNFSLSNDGEYLALVMPKARRSPDFDPFPEQFDDVSYGSGASTSSTVERDAGRCEQFDGEGHFADGGERRGRRSLAGDRLQRLRLAFRHAVGRLRSKFGRRRAGAVHRPHADGRRNGQHRCHAAVPAYVRFPFNVTDKDQLTSLQLDLRFDDGFIAYLNGREVRRVNFAEDFVYTQPQWNSYAGNQTTQLHRGCRESHRRVGRCGHVRSDAVSCRSW